MIRGVVKVDTCGETDMCSMAVFSECTHLCSQNICGSYFVEERIKFMYDENLQVGIVLGSHGRRSIFLSHLCCAGETCNCVRLVLPLLSAESTHESFDSRSVQETVGLLKSSCVKFPLIAMLISDGEAVLLSYLCQDAVKVEVLGKGAYSIRDCFVTQLEGEETPLEHILASYPSRADFLRFSSQLVDCLYDQMKLWPKAGGYGVVYSNRGGECKLRCHGNNNSNEKKRPKGPITAFNYFAMTARASVLQERDDNPSNNELNASQEQKAPYMVVAEDGLDELVDSEGIDCESFSSESNAMTAYNHFVHQERQFILSLNLDDIQTRMGRHAGDRWKHMCDDEKNLYKALSSVEEARWKKNV
eukprot:gene6390-7044_t